MVWGTRLTWIATLAGLPAVGMFGSSTLEFDGPSTFLFLLAGVIGSVGLALAYSARIEFERAMHDFTHVNADPPRGKSMFLREFFLDVAFPFRRYS